MDEDARSRLYIELNRQLLTFAINAGERAASRGAAETAARWFSVAAGFASSGGFTGVLADKHLEFGLAHLGSSIPNRPHDGPARPRFAVLHVLSEAYAIGGHTRLCQLWIEFDQPNRTHTILLLRQKGAVPSELIGAVRRSGGVVIYAEADGALLTKAAYLRKLALESADLVVLHVHPDDVVPAVAFAEQGGPPVILVNHADHLFWVGAASCDITAEIRESGRQLSLMSRAVRRAEILPVPLELSMQPKRSMVASVDRVQLGIPNDAVVLLTMGSPHKYIPCAGLNFPEVALSILERCPNTFVVAIGPDREGWRSETEKSGGRLLALGAQPQGSFMFLRPDVYLEGFPIGSLTALLEVCVCGTPCVRAPKSAPAPFTSDDPSFEEFDQPDDVAAYVRSACAYVRDPAKRSADGGRLSARIREFHECSAWVRRLRAIEDVIPSVHQGASELYPQPMPSLQRKFWVRWQETLGNGSPAKALEALMVESVRFNLDVSEFFRVVAEQNLCKMIAVTKEMKHSSQTLLAQSYAAMAIALYNKRRMNDAARFAWRAVTMDSAVLGRASIVRLLLKWIVWSVIAMLRGSQRPRGNR